MTATTTAVISPPLYGWWPLGAKGVPDKVSGQKGWTQSGCTVVAGSTWRREVDVVNDFGLSMDLTGYFEATRFIATVRGDDNSLLFSIEMESLFRSRSKFLLQGLPADTAGVKKGVSYRFDLFAITPDGSPISLLPSPIPFPIELPAHLAADVPSQQNGLIIPGVSSGSPARITVVSNSLGQGGSACTAVLGGWQGFVQHRANQLGYDIGWNGGGLIGDATPPAAIDYIPWIPLTASASGFTCEQILALYPHVVRDYPSRFFVLDMLTNNLQKTSGAQTGAQAYGHLKLAMDQYLNDWAALPAGTSTILVESCMPQAKNLSPPSTPAYSAYQETIDANALTLAQIGVYQSQGADIHYVDTWSRFNTWRGPMGEDMSGAINGTAIAPYPLTAAQIALLAFYNVSDQTMGAVGSNKAFTPGTFADGLHYNVIGAMIKADAHTSKMIELGGWPLKV